MYVHPPTLPRFNLQVWNEMLNLIKIRDQMIYLVNQFTSSQTGLFLQCEKKINGQFAFFLEPSLFIVIYVCYV